MSAYIAAELVTWPPKHHMAEILRSAGFNLYVGRYSIRIEDFSHFTFQVYGGDLGDPTIEADADTVEEMMQQGQRVSDALSRAGIRHRFEIYDDQDNLSGYLHHQWPLEAGAEPAAGGNAG